MEKRLIYALKCPFTNDIHYIGKSTTGMRRPSSHLTKSHSIKIQEWVSELKILGQIPSIEVLMYVNEDEDIDSCESFLINKNIKNGAYLLNSTLIQPINVLPKLKKTKTQGVKEIGAFIKKRRKETGLTQKKFASYIGVSLLVIRQLEQGIEKGYNTTQIDIILSAFGCRIGVRKITE
jgi:DNA-binding transcriptional regulator YiaG